MDSAVTVSHRQFCDHVVIFPAFGMGHFIPMLEFAKRLSAFHCFSVTFITADWQVPASAVSKYKRRLSPSKAIDIRFVELPAVEIPADVTDWKLRMPLLEQKTKPLLENALLRELESGPVAAFVTDFFCTAFFDVPMKLSLPLYVFFVSAASFLCSMLYCPTFAQKIELPINDQDRSVEIPGLPPMQARDLPSPFLNDSWKWFMGICVELPKARGFLINTCLEMEEPQLKTLQEGKVIDMQKETEYYAVGPLIQSSLFEEAEEENAGEEGEDCLRWLDAQPPKSVLYVSFGSRAQLSPEQIAELAYGLELSEQGFLWVLQKPLLSPMVPGEEPKDGTSFLPEGFLERTQARGLVFTKWAPQVAILSHASTGGFVSHCGWNSTLESIVCGVPVLAWPRGAEQRLNALLLVNELKVGVGVTEAEGGLVKREEVKKGANQLMRNDEMTENMKRLSSAANSATAEGGSSFESLHIVASTWKSLGKA
eukprot:TRINITY_DN912_c0_g1_i1.p1 TRINITY_DN912_c0_g1~~TRINITY_DN912_c0_g1_i1.p1  ORF type:complete len:482 (+),score=21.24 TRINITY_DN912_c0_g1_i1:57-1502(+)